MDNEFKAVLFAIAFHAKLTQAQGAAGHSKEQHERIARESAEAAEIGAAAFNTRFPEAG